MGNRAENAELGPKRDSQGPGSDAATAWDLVPVPKSPTHAHQCSAPSPWDTISTLCPQLIKCMKFLNENNNKSQACF